VGDYRGSFLNYSTGLCLALSLLLKEHSLWLTNPASKIADFSFQDCRVPFPALHCGL
jgi:hypothetical protein